VLVAWVACLLAALPACQTQTAKPDAPAPTKPADFAKPPPPPEWWHDAPLRTDGVMSVCALADDFDLLTARKKAIATATRVFTEQTGAAPKEPTVQADSGRWDDGPFRAFVRITAPEK